MKKYAVIGAGLMGRVVAKDLLETEFDAQVTLVDIGESILREAAGFIGQKRLMTCQLSITDTDASTEILSQHDVVVCAAPHWLSLPCLEAAIRAQVSCVDLVGEAPEERQALNNRAVEAGITIIPGCGVAPGLSNVCVGKGVELLDEVNEAVIYVGGIPKEKTPPLNYQTVYSLESVFEACIRPARILHDGKETEVEALSGLEYVDFPQPVGQLEAFYTDGLASLILTMKGKITDHLAEKTLRYSGFAERIRFLQECGLLETIPVNVGAAEIAPREQLIQLLTPKLKLGHKGDILAMRVIVKGLKNQKKQTHIFELIDYYDPETKYTAMARTTCFPAVCAAIMISNKSIFETGVHFPENIFSGNRYDQLVSQLAKKGITMTHNEQ